jgi:hypothetical protein
MSKVIYEFYYSVGSYGFSNRYDCVVDKETNKMLYGNVFYKSGAQSGERFAINKNSLNQIHSSIERHYGLIYRVRIERDNLKDAEKKAKEIIYDHMIDFVEKFKNCEED